MSVIEVRDLRKAYGGNKALHGVDLSIAQGEIFALLGPNGAGKTTCVEILEGFRHRDSGDVKVLGMDPELSGHGARQFRDRIGIVLQSTSDAGDLTVNETIRHFSGYYSKPRDPDEVVIAVGLEEKKDALIRSLSGGQRRRLDVGLGIIGSPELLFLDEPTTGFDPEARRSFWALIRQLQNGGSTILLTTHYLDEAEEADRICIINHGKIVTNGTPNEIKEKLIEEYILVDAEDRNALKAELDNKKIPYSDEQFIKIQVSRKNAQSMIKNIDTTFTHLEIHAPTLEDAYLEIIGGSKE